ncbi:hypothetical protein XELAEV_18010541mg [Xenopus laevis]|uniref:Uncharacterized protein n=1 Tax=Xenopus laevis TaxID=8355 RepID=A0A974DVJ8_XENLA|nr:hypothetical protein XELAEV_18010541mg [Xenopus laevis]
MSQRVVLGIEFSHDSTVSLRVHLFTLFLCHPFFLSSNNFSSVPLILSFTRSPFHLLIIYLLTVTTFLSKCPPVY